MTIELLQQVRLLDPVSHTDRVADVLLEAGVIQGIEPTIATYPDSTNIYPCQGMLLAPGLVDLYSHSGEPGLTFCPAPFRRAITPLRLPGSKRRAPAGEWGSRGVGEMLLDPIHYSQLTIHCRVHPSLAGQR
jgi:hypothetical protein